MIGSPPSVGDRIVVLAPLSISNTVMPAPRTGRVTTSSRLVIAIHQVYRSSLAV